MSASFALMSRTFSWCEQGTIHSEKARRPRMHVERCFDSGRAEQKAPRAPAGTLRCRARTCAPPQSLLISFTVNKYPQPAYIRCTQRVSATHIRQWATARTYGARRPFLGCNVVIHSLGGASHAERMFVRAAIHKHVTGRYGFRASHALVVEVGIEVGIAGCRCT